MLRVTVELVPFGDEAGKKVIETLYIGNVGGDAETANYKFWIGTDPRGGDPFDRPKATGSVTGFKRARGALALLSACLRRAKL